VGRGRNEDHELCPGTVLVARSSARAIRFVKLIGACKMKVNLVRTFGWKPQVKSYMGTYVCSPCWNSCTTLTLVHSMNIIWAYVLCGFEDTAKWFPTPGLFHAVKGKIAWNASSC
jgi:hypothetical protein